MGIEHMTIKMKAGIMVSYAIAYSDRFYRVFNNNCGPHKVVTSLDDHLCYQACVNTFQRELIFSNDEPSNDLDEPMTDEEMSGESQLIVPTIIFFEQLCIKMDLPDTGIILSLILIEKALRNYKRYRHIDIQNRMISIKNLKNLVTVALLITQKFYCDKFYSNGVVAKMANTDLKLMNANELEFMSLIDWDVNISYKELEFYLTCSDTFFRSFEDKCLFQCTLPVRIKLQEQIHYYNFKQQDILFNQINFQMQ